MTPEEVGGVLGFILVVAALVLAINRVERNEGKEPSYHAAYFAFSLFLAILLPEKAHNALFSPITVVCIGTVYPLYQSIQAVVSVRLDDDKVWVLYWIIHGTIVFTTSWVEDIARKNSGVYSWWYAFEFIFFLWLQFPLTDGCALIHKYIILPYLVPLVEPLAKEVGGWIDHAVNLAITTSHIWIAWAIFAFLPAFVKRFVAVTIGTAYPTLASIVAVSTPQYEDDTFWLTYWSCFGILFITMDFLELYIGKLPGFYILFIFCCIYLMVPIFNGADKVFRQILVPLFGLQEMLLYRDAVRVKAELKKQLPKGRNKEMEKMISDMFLADEEDEEFGSIYKPTYSSIGQVEE